MRLLSMMINHFRRIRYAFTIPRGDQSIKDWLTEILWNMLPDKCEHKYCARYGVRGNENIIEGKVMCDYCHSKK
jgi:hypothetical protein